MKLKLIFIELKLKLFKKISLLFKNIEILKHNGEDIIEYPTNKGWYLVPFPMEKGRPFNADNLATISRASFLKDERFNKARDAAESRWGKKPRDITWRLDILLSCVSYARSIADKDSIFLECGTGMGYMAAAICNYFPSLGHDLYLVDSFLPEVPNENGEQISGIKSFAYADNENDVQAYFKSFSNVKIIKGFVPDILYKLPNYPISFLHLDLNNSIAEDQALNALIHRMKKGGIILFDDYGGFGGEAQAEVHEAFSKKMNARLFTLPTGQAIYIHT
jgi:hypothetical protein